MPGEKDALVVLRLDDRAAGTLGMCQNRQLVAGIDVLVRHKRMARMGNEEGIVQPLQQRVKLHQLLVGIDAEDLVSQQLLFQSVVVVQAGLRAPADIQRAGHMRLRIVEDLLEFLPIVDLGEGQGLHRSARDDQAVKIAVLDLRKALVEAVEMRLRDVFAPM